MFLIVVAEPLARRPVSLCFSLFRALVTVDPHDRADEKPNEASDVAREGSFLSVGHGFARMSFIEFFDFFLRVGTASNKTARWVLTRFVLSVVAFSPDGETTGMGNDGLGDGILLETIRRVHER
jgi:hypothetical protein